MTYPLVRDLAAEGFAVQLGLWPARWLSRPIDTTRDIQAASNPYPGFANSTAASSKALGATVAGDRRTLSAGGDMLAEAERATKLGRLVPTIKLWLVLGSLAVSVAALLYFSRNVRPIADDYCFTAGVADKGIIGYSLWYREAWGSGLMAIAVGGVFGMLIRPGMETVGYPALIALVFGMLSTGMALSIVLLAPFRHIGTVRTFKFGTATSAGIVAAFGCIASTLYFGQFSPNASLGYASLYWMSYVTVHLVPILLLPAYLAFLLRSTPHSVGPRVSLLCLGALFSLFLGAFSPAESAAVACALALTTLCCRKSLRILEIRLWTWLVFAMVMGAGVLNAYLSPGRKTRELVFHNEPLDSGATLRAVPYDAIRFLWETAMSPATFVAIAAGVLAALVYSWLARPSPGLRLIDATSINRFTIMTTFLGFTTLALAFTVAYGEATLYKASYHVVTIQLCVVLFAAFLGVGIGLLATESKESRPWKWCTDRLVLSVAS